MSNNNDSHKETKSNRSPDQPNTPSNASLLPVPNRRSNNSETGPLGSRRTTPIDRIISVCESLVNLASNATDAFNLTGIPIQIAKRASDRFTERVGDKLGDVLGNGVCLALDKAIDLSDKTFHRCFVSNPFVFKNQYYASVKQDCYYFNQPGGRLNTPFKLSLQDVFVDVSVLPNNGSSGKASRGEEPEIDSIWDYIAAGSRSKRRYCRIMVLGEPGMGKSTLLRYIALNLVGGKRPRLSRKSNFVSPRLPRLIPIVIKLRELYPFILENHLSIDLEQLILKQQEIRDKNLVVPHHWFRNSLKNGSCLLLIDGIDEVSGEKNLAKVSGWIDQQMNRYHNNRFIITSRNFAYRPEEFYNIDTCLNLRKLNFKRTKQLILNWHAHYEQLSSFAHRDKAAISAAQRAAEIKSSNLIARLKEHPELQEIAANPLMLNMMITVHENGGTLPKSRAELYDEICTVLLKSRGNGVSYGGVRLNTGSKRYLLEILALELIKREILSFDINFVHQVLGDELKKFPSGVELSASDFVDHISNTSGLLLRTELDNCQFSHRCIQEYLAASRLKEIRGEAIILDNIPQRWWSETIRLYAAQNDATAIVSTAVKLATTNHSNQSFVFKLAYDCLEEGMKVDPQVRTNAENLLDHHLESSDPRLRRYVAEMRLYKRFESLISIDANRSIDGSTISCAEYQLFIDERLVIGHYHQPYHWNNTSFPKNSGNQTITGISAVDALHFCDWLTEYYAIDGFQFRLPTVQEEQEFIEEFTEHQQPLGCWCSTENLYSIEGIHDHIVLRLGDELISELTQLVRALDRKKDRISHLSQEILRINHTVQGSKRLSHLEYLLDREIGVRGALSLPESIGVHDHSINILLDFLLKLIAGNNAAVEGRKTGRALRLKEAGQIFQELTSYLEKSTFFRRDSAISIAKELSQRFGMNEYLFRTAVFSLCDHSLQGISRNLERISIHLEARVNDLKELQTGLRKGEDYLSSGLNGCGDVLGEFVQDIKTNSVHSTSRDRPLETYSSDMIGYFNLKEHSTSDDRFIESAIKELRDPKTDRNRSIIQANLLKASSTWTYLANRPSTGRGVSLNQQSTIREAARSYQRKRSAALTAYASLLLLDLQTKDNSIPTIGSIRIIREHHSED
jgi:NACHT domain